MRRWTVFSPEEVKNIEIKPIEDNTERKCPCCEENSVRLYYRELNIGRFIGTTWAWCYSCKKSIHFTGAQCSDSYEFNDPVGKDIAAGMSGKWYEYLNTLWEKGMLPQIFIKKEEAKKKVKEPNKAKRNRKK